MTLKGNLNADYSVYPYTISYDILAKDNATNRVFWWNNYIITITDGTTYEDFSLSGKFYYPDYGYVTISTPTPFRFYNGNSTPSSGVFLLTGKIGTAGGSTSARLTVLSTTTYQIQADTNGDGSYDWVSDALYW